MYVNKAFHVITSVCDGVMRFKQTYMSMVSVVQPQVTMAESLSDRSSCLQ